MDNSEFFDRQSRISWWDQQRLFEARVMVVGAGALGNEVLKNLALLGVGHILVIDFDQIEASNLSRSVLFRTGDVADNRRKAEIAAQRAQALNPNPKAVVKAIHGDVVWEIGGGVFRQVDVVIGCLDNIEARRALNLACWRANTPWINGGMWELSGSVSVFDAVSEHACYECGMTEMSYRMAQKRYSCFNQTVKTNINAGREPTTQTTSALVAAVQCQEAVKLLHKLPSLGGKQLVFNGAPHFYTRPGFDPFRLVELALNPACPCHIEEKYTGKNFLSLPHTSARHTTGRQLIEEIKTQTGWPTVYLELNRSYVVAMSCPLCGYQSTVDRPLFQVQDVDTVCPTCEVRCPDCGLVSIGQPDCPNCGMRDINELRLTQFHTLDAEDSTFARYLDVPLTSLGVPPLDILIVSNNQEDYRYVELSGDLVDLWQVET